MSVAARKGRILRALFGVLKGQPEGLPAKDAIAATRDEITLTPEEEGAFEESGVEKFPPLVRFATIPVVKAGWMLKQDGTWIVTDAGLAALNDYADPGAFYKAARKLYVAWQKEEAVELSDEEESETEVTGATSLEDTEDKARQEILDHMGKMPPYDFQQACGKLIAALGHQVQWVSPPGPDGGIDFIAYTDPIGVTSRRIKGQAKRQQKKQDVDAIGAFISKLAKPDDVGVYIALGGFTAPAEALARSDERRMILIDGPDFLKLWIEHYEKLDEEARGLLRLRPIWHLVRVT
jgi:restriction system protein